MPKGLNINKDQITDNPNVFTPQFKKELMSHDELDMVEDSFKNGYDKGHRAAMKTFASPTNPDLRGAYHEGFMAAKRSLRNCGLPIGEENHRKLNKALTAYFDAISITEMRDLAHEHLKLYFLLDEHGAKERDAFITEWVIEQPSDSEGT
jgi:hypothetical protein